MFTALKCSFPNSNPSVMQLLVDFKFGHAVIEATCVPLPHSMWCRKLCQPQYYSSDTTNTGHRTHLNLTSCNLTQRSLISIKKISNVSIGFKVTIRPANANWFAIVAYSLNKIIKDCVCFNFSKFGLFLSVRLGFTTMVYGKDILKHK